MHGIDQAITTYLAAIAIEGKSPRTIDSYAESIEVFRKIGRGLGFPDEVEAYTVDHVYAFLHVIRDRGASPAYQHRRHREVQTLFSWCVRMGFVADNVFKRVPRVKLGYHVREPFRRQDVQSLLDSFDLTQLTGSRNYATVLLLLDSGVRVSECVNVRIEDIDWTSRRVFVRQGKGDKQRWVGVSDLTLAALRAYVELFRGPEPGPLLLTSAGEPMASPNTLRVILRRVAARLNLSHVYPHRFRHTFATWAIESGAREIDVQMLLGHSDLKMVQRYSRTYTSEQAVRAHHDLSPVLRLLETTSVTGLGRDIG